MISVAIIALAVFWVVCGVLNYGLTLAHFQCEFPSLADLYFKRDRSMCLFASMAGPASLFAILVMNVKFVGSHLGHGFMFVWRNPHGDAS